MIFVGIDVASQKHDAVITRGQDDILTGSFTLSNDLDRFKKLRDEILSHTEHLEDVRIGIEETGIYSKNISEFLALCGFTVHKLNPVLTYNSRKAQSIRLTKTDKIDALAISRYVELNFKRLNSYTPTLYIYDEMKSLSRARLDVMKRLIASKTEFVRLLDMVFPEFRRQFNPHSKWAYQLFSKHIPYASLYIGGSHPCSLR
jgi:transposase